MKITERTNFTISLFTFATLIVFIISSVWYISGWKTAMENSILNCGFRLDKVEQIDTDRDVILIQVQTKLVGIQTDLKWIINSMGGK